MLLGKRPRPPMRRTTSMTEFSLDISTVQIGSSETQNAKENQNTSRERAAYKRHPSDPNPTGFDPRFMSTVSPRNPRRNSTDFIETAHFMRACGLCKRKLGPGRDIYMYRGDSAFCSLECRQQQMKQDERKEKCSLTSVKKEAASPVASETSSSGEKVAAAY